MAGKVVYAPFSEGETDESISEKARLAFRAAGLGGVAADGAVTGVKTHFGERGNTSFVPARHVKAVVDEVRDAGGKPCLIETSTLYRGERHNAVDHFNLAVKHGFGPEAMGCPLLFVDGLRGNLHVEVPVGLKHCETVAVAGDFTLMPSVIAVTHLTGHMLGGLGGAIKNVAMGLSSRAGKLRQHSDGRPHVKDGECVACGTCAEWCPEDAITIDDAGDAGVAIIDSDRCIGCGECVAVCPVGAVGFRWSTSTERFNEMMAEYAFGILKGKQAGFVTFILKTTKDCNCGAGGEVVGPDLGVLASRDPVAIDQAAVDLLARAHGSDLLAELWPGLPYKAQLEHGEAIGLGSREYELETI